MRFFRVSSVLALLAAVFPASAAAFGFTDEAQLPPDMQLGALVQLPAERAERLSSGIISEQQSGYFPGGVGMNRDGLISGTPQLGGSYQVWLAVKHQCPGDSSELALHVLRRRLGPVARADGRLLPGGEGKLVLIRAALFGERRPDLDAQW